MKLAVRSLCLHNMVSRIRLDKEAPARAGWAVVAVANSGSVDGKMENDNGINV